MLKVFHTDEELQLLEATDAVVQTHLLNLKNTEQHTMFKIFINMGILVRSQALAKQTNKKHSNNSISKKKSGINKTEHSFTRNLAK